ncbi:MULTISPECIES: M42 family metallopeptidase [Bacillales]|jgi:putative aminopeptidase FrvX|uniref:Peptidase M28 n=1 Tax=Brevibacillus aydinogluensis TaxID=927786 RepID=A0AA48RDA5_9BACL|nr:MULTISPECIES: M42 family metallopeptidase [Bacillales]REK61294.1 MAG: peptidase M28 [Brevibacillus sp.]MBR8660894.1 M42 family metallopeptidase [Brevibacillus sp. NL20B1]MDT3416923.1 putative aminopeptidase FrvX [Brevibacillus aydinogluensis]NNV04526.1 M42 family peptidase [Brevibacillus sp. MCWH]UFJ61406.1 M42 family metallopeptidase [Anoxybacillus sediminis]
MNQFQLELWKRLTEAPGVSGFEAPVRTVMREYISRYTQEIVCDNLGSLFGVMRGDENGPRIMAAGHLDEVGFMVTRISDKGFLSFQTVGGWWGQVLLAQRVQVLTPAGAIDGVISSIPPHVLSDDQRNRPMDVRNMYIDIGVDSRQEAEQLGVRPGQPVVPVCPFTVMANPKRLMAKAWDNRYGCSLAVELAKELHDCPSHPNVVYVGATVQEELAGARGAKTAAAVIEPDLFLALDASPAGDIPGVREEGGKLGGGVLMRLYDPVFILQPGLRDFLIAICEEENIPYQFYVAKGGTDAGPVQYHGQGVPSAVIGIPARYIHSHAAIIDRDDYEAAKRLLFAAVRKLDRAALDAIKPR